MIGNTESSDSNTKDQSIQFLSLIQVWIRQKPFSSYFLLIQWDLGPHYTCRLVPDKVVDKVDVK